MVGEELMARFDRARAAWPGVDVAVEEFASVCSDPAMDPEECYIAFACARGDLAGLAAFELRYFPHVDSALARLRVPDDVQSEVKQILRSRLFVAGDRGVSPRILTYAGRGSLEGLVRVAAVRAAIDHLRATDRYVQEHPFETIATPESDVALRVMRSIDTKHFKVAFEAAIAALSERDRTLLRLQLVDGLNVDEIGAVYGVHRTTAARWVARVREDVATVTRRRLAQQLKLGADDIDELVQSVQSRLELTVSRLLRGERASAPSE